MKRRPTKRDGIAKPRERDEERKREKPRSTELA
jgi:hypothetical protein